MELTIICPVFNEIRFIDKLAESLLASAPREKEIFLVDGGSSDGTIQRIEELAQKHTSIRLVTNPARFVSPGFNKAFLLSSGKNIAFIGAHAEYPPDYFSVALQYLSSGMCEAVGGPLRQDGKNASGKTIAHCMSTRFGVGDTEFRTSREKKYVQSVAFAVYKREVFEKAGLLDEALVRNQDDEFHYRLNEKGFRILMVPEMESTYFVRDTLPALFRQYYQYGLYKPLVLKKVHSGIRIRHLVPSLFVIYLLSLPLLLLNLAWLFPLAFYFLLDLLFAMRSPGSIARKLFSMLVFPCLHLSYGLGFIFGLSKRP